MVAINECLSPFGPKVIIFCWYLILLVPPVRFSFDEYGIVFSLTFLIDRTWSHRRRNICSLQIYHYTSSNAIWRAHEGWYLYRALINSNHAKFPLKFTAKLPPTCLASLVLLGQILVSGICTYVRF